MTSINCGASISNADALNVLNFLVVSKVSGRDVPPAQCPVLHAALEALGNSVDCGKTVGLNLEKFYAEWGMPLHLPDRAWTEAVPVFADAAQTKHIGRGTSGTWSPILKKYVVMARIASEQAKLGNQIFIEEVIEAVSYSVPATVVKTPFFDPPRKKAWGSGEK